MPFTAYGPGPPNIFAVVIQANEHDAMYRMIEQVYPGDQHHHLRPGTVLVAANSDSAEVARNLGITPSSSNATILPLSSTIPPHGTAPNDVWAWWARQIGGPSYAR
jgi:hypothetical protein